MRGLILALLCYLPSLIASAPRNGPVPHILEVKSRPASPHQFPWLASMQQPKGDGEWQHSCGASLIAFRDGQTESDILVSAAHCLTECYCRHEGTREQELCERDMKGLAVGRHRVVVGEHALDDDNSEQRNFLLVSLRCHDFVVTKGPVNDIAVVKLSSPVKFSDKIQPITLPAQGEDPATTDYHDCLLAGWGYMGKGGWPNVLRYANISTIYDQERCSKWWKEEIYDTDRMICAGYEWKSSRKTTRQLGCAGDSGGSMTCLNENGTNTLVGVISRAEKPFCAHNGGVQPDVYTKVAAYVEWIVKNAEEITDVGGE